MRFLPVQLDVVDPGIGKIKFIKYGKTVVGEISKERGHYQLHYTASCVSEINEALETLSADLIKTYTITDKLMK